ncbi:MAG: hypothetical protein QOG52_1818, partial [Frankiaceae bacterium]|nr:hypothetical protein [Frankiaceae bacterium]
MHALNTPDEKMRRRPWRGVPARAAAVVAIAALFVPTSLTSTASAVTPPAVVGVPGATSATGAAANTSSFTTPGFGVTIPVGDTVFVLVTERHLSGAPVFSSVTDSVGNAYVRDGTGGNATSPLYLLRGNVTHAISASTTITVAFSGTNKCDEIAVVVARVAGTAARDGANPVATSVTSSQTVHSVTVTAPHVGDLLFGGDSMSGTGGLPVTVGGNSFSAA